MASGTFDLNIVGGGIVGLWCARRAIERGAKVRLLDEHHIGAGASGGILGALMPHQPINWNEKKQFQLDGLLSLQGEIERLEEEAGQSAGYSRIGRIMPIGNDEKRRQSEQWAQGAKTHWPSPMAWTLAPANGYPDLLAEDAGRVAINHDTLSARVNPRAYVSVMETALSASAHFHFERRRILAEELDDAAPTILAAGVGTFALIDTLLGGQTISGSAVKGQGALLRPLNATDPSMPIIYDNGVYVIAHENGLIAIGSTSENEFASPNETDEKLDDIVAKAKMLCPFLEGAEIVERWAGLRPKAVGREPLVGLLPEKKNTIAATGGFKISFAVAHLMAEFAVAQALDEPVEIPAFLNPQKRLA